MTQESATNTRYSPNTWLISNTSLYFSTRILQGYDKIGYREVLELSKLSEAILLADNILTLEGG